MSERRNADGSLSIGILEDMTPVKETTKEEKAEKPKKATKKK